MVEASQSLAKNSSFFSRPKKPSQAALSGEQALRDLERIERSGVPGVRVLGQLKESEKVTLVVE